MTSIAVDLNNVLNNLNEEWILIDYNKMYNDTLSYEDMYSWATHKYVKPECGEKVYDILDQPGYFRNLKLKDKWTQEGFTFLCENFDVYVVTSWHGDTIKDKIEWLKYHFPEFNPKRLIACHDKSLINTDWIIDDNPRSVEQFHQKSIIMDAPYNQYLDLEKNKHDFTRKNNWKDIKSFFEDLIEMEEPHERTLGKLLYEDS